MTFGYWSIRGLAEPLRLFMEFLHVPYKQVFYQQPEGVDQWFKVDKPALKTEFPNLPYLKYDGDKVICETEAIACYLPTISKIECSSIKNIEAIKYFEMQGIVQDIRRFIVTCCYDKDFQTKKVEVFAKEGRLMGILRNMDKHLEKNTFVFGTKASYYDFILYEMVDECDAIN